MDHYSGAESLYSYKLNTGHCIPSIGLGTVNFTSSETDVTVAVLNAIKTGYRHIDTAKYYGTESAIGKALSQAFEDGLVKREDMFITSKLWCDDNVPEAVVPALRRSLSALQLDYLDLYLMHFPVRLSKGAKIPPREDEFLPVDIQGSWRALETCLQLGLTKAVGVSNFTIAKLTSLLQTAEVVPAVNQVEMHPVWQQIRLREFCSSNGIHVSAWSPLGAPGTKYGSNRVLENPIICRIASKHCKSPAQVVLRWGVQVGVSVLPKSYNPARQLKNFSIFDWTLTTEDIESISKIEQSRISLCEFFCNQSTSPYWTVEQLWDGEL